MNRINSSATSSWLEPGVGRAVVVFVVRHIISKVLVCLLPAMPVDARRLIRKMRGGAQAHLIEASDGHFYVVKFLQQSAAPAHPGQRMDRVGLSAATWAFRRRKPSIIRVSEDFLRANPDVHLQLGSRRHPVEPGWHFGSRFPGDPARNVVYDFLPDTLLDKVENLGDFPGDPGVRQMDGQRRFAPGDVFSRPPENLVAG